MKNIAKQLVILLISFTLINCAKSDKNTEANNSQMEVDSNLDDGLIIVSKKQFENENLSFGKLEEASFPTLIKATGLIDVPPNNRAIVSAHIGGYIKNSPLLVGDKVKKGQFLFSIENILFLELQQEYLETSEQLTYLQAEYDRQNEMYKEKISSKKSFLKAKSEFNKTQIRYKSLRKKLELLNMNPALIENGELSSISSIYAPIGGDITDVNVNTGSYVSPADVIMEIVNTEHIHLEINIFEKDALSIKEGQKVFFSLPESSAKMYEGEVHLIGKSIGIDRTIRVHVHMEGESVNLFLPGMFVQAQIVVSDTLNMALPESAVIDLNDKTYVLQLKSAEKDQYLLEKKEVITGSSHENQILIRNFNTLDSSAKYLLDSYNLINKE